MSKLKIILAVTGASGSIYARAFLDRISQMQEIIEECALIFTTNGNAVWEYELGSVPDYQNIPHIRIADNSNMFDAVASGSAGYQSMTILPCSMGTLGRIASGVSNDLISRSADVILKEKRQLILVPRETPYNAIHLQNMLTLDRAGAFVMPASPFFYHKPKNIDDLIQPFIERILEKTGVDAKPFRWGV